MKALRSASALAVCVVVTGMGAATAGAQCPRSGSPSREVCKYSNAILMPSVAGHLYAPSDAMGTWLGGGVQIVLFTWSDNSDRFGPGQGKIFFDIGALSSSEDGAGTMVKYRGGANVSFERNASRSWVIPYFGATVGGMHEDTLGRRAFIEGLLGAHLWYTANVIFDVEGGYLFPFKDADDLAGVTAQATLSVSLW